MAAKTLVCAALLISVNLAPSTPPPTVVTMPDEGHPEFCTFINLMELPGNYCYYMGEDCVSGAEIVYSDTCGVYVSTRCPCEDPVLAVAMPDMDGRPANVYAGPRPPFAGISVPPNAFMGGAVQTLKPNAGFTVAYDEPISVGHRTFRVFGLRRPGTGEIYNLGYELVGVAAATRERYEPATVRATFGNDWQVTARVAGEDRTFHVTCIGESSVPARKKDQPLVPVPDHTVPVQNVLN